METIDHYFPEFVNSAIVFQFFGKWPSLHDSELIEITLNRELGFDFTGPKIRLVLYAFNVTAALGDPDRKESKLVLIFDHVELDYIRDFNHQNAMADFLMEKYYCKRLRQQRFRIRFGEFGALVKFTCKNVTVESIDPFTPLDYFKDLAV